MKPADDELTRLMICVIAREMRDGQIVAFGLHAELMLAAAFLAQRLHAPNLVIRHGLRVERGAQLGAAAWSADRANTSHTLVEYLETHDAILGVANPRSPARFCDVFFVGGMQIDQQGSTNLIGIRGEDGRMRTRGPGSVGTPSIGSLAKNVVLFSREHTSRRFVPQVDYVSVPGWQRRRDRGLQGGPELCVSSLGVMNFIAGKMHLRSAHPGVTAEEVQENTGFHLPLAEDFMTTAPPTQEELAVLETLFGGDDLLAGASDGGS
jgi:acyl CoA:acetate/3-ketoacid CoA transferase beta subunit